MSKQPLLTLYVGPPGSGKSTDALKVVSERTFQGECYYINQDTQGKTRHLELFHQALGKGHDIVVDRMNFSLEQRQRYLGPAKLKGYKTFIIVMHEDSATCLRRCLKREGHPTIGKDDIISANNALTTFFRFYERVEDSEADEVFRTYSYPSRFKASAIICDLDGTLCNIDHRIHFVNPGLLQEDGSIKKDWKSFFLGIRNDRLNGWCWELLSRFSNYKIVLCSGRSEQYREATLEWLEAVGCDYGTLFMRQDGDFRQDWIVKENILDFEILTQYKPLFSIDDRKQVVDMWRCRGIVCLQCAEGNF